MSVRAPQRDRRTTKILHIEDNPENRALVRALLEAEGYTLVEAEDGLSGIEAALREEPALILLDINLPGVDGYEVGVILKSFPSLSATPVIAVTAYAMDGDRQRTLVAGCDGYIHKPIDVDAFPRQITEFLRGKRERLEEHEAGPYLRELNQRLVYRLVSQVEELKRLNQHFVRRAVQLEELHAAVQDITSEMGVVPLLERLLPALARALGTPSLVVELSDPPGVRVAAAEPVAPPPGVLVGTGTGSIDEWTEVEWSLPLAVRGRSLGVMTARHVLPAGARSDEEQLLKIVANQVAIAVENARLYRGMEQRAAEEESLVEAGRLLTGTLDLSEVLHRLAELVRTRLSGDLVRIWLLEPTGELRFAARAGDVRAPEQRELSFRRGEGTVGWILEQRRPLVLPDLASDQRVTYPDDIRDEGFASFLGVPLLLQDQAVGVLVVGSRTRRDFSPEEVALTEALATSAAAAIRNARLYAETQQRLRQTETLLSVSRAVSATLDISEVARRTIRELVRALDADQGGAWRLAPARDRLVPLAGYHVPRDIFGEVSGTLPPTGNALMEAIRALGSPVYATDSQADPRFDHPLLRLVPHKSVLVLPIRVKDELVGGFAIVWTRRHHIFTADELRLAEGMVRQAAIALENARLLAAEREARERLAISETRYRELFENVIDVVYLHDLDGRILEINEAGVRASGYTREELLTMNIAEFLAPQDRERAAQMVRRIAAGERAVEALTAEFVGKDGGRLILETVVRAVCKDGVPVAILGSARDITVRRSLERRQDALVALSRELATEIELERLLPRIAEEARRLMGMHSALLLLIEGDDLVIRGASEVEEPLLAEPRLSVQTSLTGTVVRDRRPLVYANLAADPTWRATPLVRQFGYQAMLAVPVGVKEQTLGLLQLLHREPRTFPLEEIEFLRALATQAALAIDNARLFAAQREEAEISAALLRLAEAIEGVQDVDQVLHTVVRTTAELLGGTQCLLFLADPTQERLIPTAAFGLPEEGTPAFLALTETSRLPSIQSALQTQEPVRLEAGAPDFQLAPALADVLGIRSMLIIPLLSGGRLMGSIGVHTPGRPHAFTPKEIALARGIAAHAVVAIDKARLFQQTQARLRETETLLNITKALSSTLDPTETMRRVAREIAQTLGADMVGAYLADAEHACLRPIAGYRVPKELHQKFMEFPIPIQGHPAMEETWRTREAIWSSDSATDPRIDRESFSRFPHRSLLFVPMIVKGEPIGGFFVIWWEQRRQLTPEEIRLVTGISDQAAMFIENARLYSEATRRRREAEELARLARMLTESLDAADVGERIVESSLLLLGGRFSVLRLQQPDGSLKLIASKGDAAMLGRLLPIIAAGVGVVGRAVVEGRPVWSADVFADPSLSLPPDMRHHVEGLGLRAYLAVPLRVKREIVGVIGICDEAGRSFSDAEVALLQTFADQAAIALENSRLYGDLRAALRAVEESQQRIVQGERLRALGEMAGGVAHDFNNVLAIIVGRAEVLLNETEDPELQRQLNVIIKVALDAAQTVKRIQEFTRMRRARPFQQVHVNHLVEEIVEVTRSRWKDEAQSKGIKYEVVVETSPTPAVSGDPSEIREALTNIIFNALDAMPEGGQITLRTGVEDTHVVCAVSDTGAGMSEDVRQRIFDPFFTTKGERGTGLGLSVVYGIVTRHNGEIDVQSRLGQGTTFVIRLPIGGETQREAAPRVTVRKPSTTGRVLVIDDEREVGDVLQDLLTRDGHTTVVCADAEAGLVRFDQEPFDLVITDLGMPGVSGWEVARLVKLRRPGTPVAMVTGWGDRIDPEEAEARGVDYVVAKPFKREHIREVVAAALGGGPSPLNPRR